MASSFVMKIVLNGYSDLNPVIGRQPQTGSISTQFYTYKDNTKWENDFFSTQSFPVTLPQDPNSAKCFRVAVFTKSIDYF
jgi:hypothetical protein